MLHRVEELALQRKHGPSINGRGETESELFLVSPLSEIKMVTRMGKIRTVNRTYK